MMAFVGIAIMAAVLVLFIGWWVVPLGFGFGLYTAAIVVRP